MYFEEEPLGDNHQAFNSFCLVISIFSLFIFPLILAGCTTSTAVRQGMVSADHESFRQHRARVEAHRPSSDKLAAKFDEQKESLDIVLDVNAIDWHLVILLSDNAVMDAWMSAGEVDMSFNNSPSTNLGKGVLLLGSPPSLIIMSVDGQFVETYKNDRKLLLQYASQKVTSLGL